MNDEFDWDIKENFMTSGPNRSQGSMRERLQKNAEMVKQRNEHQKLLKANMPLLEVLLDTRLENQTPITILHPIPYLEEELVLNENYENATFYKSIQKVIEPGTELVLKGYNPSLSQYIFTDQYQNRYELYQVDRQALMLNTNIMIDLESFLSQKES